METETSSLVLQYFKKVHNAETDKKVLEFSRDGFPIAGSCSGEIPFFSVCSPVEPLPEVPENCSVIPYDEIGQDCYFGRYQLAVSLFSLGDEKKVDDEIMKVRRLIVKGGKLIVAEKNDPEKTERLRKSLKRCGFCDLQEEISGTILFLTGVK